MNNNTNQNLELPGAEENIDVKYLNILRHVLENGREKSPVRRNSSGQWEPVDGGVKTIACPNVHFSYDMSRGFPLITTKKIAWKTLKVELEGFIKGITDKSWYQERGCSIWNSWANPQAVEAEYEYPLNYSIADGTPLRSKKECAKIVTDLGPIYGFQFRSFGKYSYDLIKAPPQNPSEESINYKPPYKIVNKSSKKIISDAGRDDCGRPLVKVELSSGYTKIVRKDHCVVSDPYEKTVCGVGYLGETEKFDKQSALYNNLKKCWNHIIERCYNPNCKEYKFYGQKGVYVCKSWHNFSRFFQEAQNIAGFSYKLRDLNEYQLDKDHFQSNCYSKETCVWIPKSMNSRYANCQPFEAISPEGKTYHHISTQVFAEIYGLNSHCISRCLRGERPHHKNWKFKKTENQNYRFSLPKDQLANIVETLRTNPMDRRMVCSAWNPNQMHMMALPPCHTQWGCTVIGDTLNLNFMMRSSDVFLGMPFNIASYGLLLSLLAKDAGFKVGNLSAMFADCHIYENSIEATKTQLAQTPKKTPQLEILDNSDDGFDIFKWDHTQAKIIGYEPHKKLKVDVVV